MWHIEGRETMRQTEREDTNMKIRQADKRNKNTVKRTAVNGKSGGNRRRDTHKGKKRRLW